MTKHGTKRLLSLILTLSLALTVFVIPVQAVGVSSRVDVTLWGDGVNNDWVEVGSAEALLADSGQDYYLMDNSTVTVTLNDNAQAKVGSKSAAGHTFKNSPYVVLFEPDSSNDVFYYEQPQQANNTYPLVPAGLKDFVRTHGKGTLTIGFAVGAKVFPDEKEGAFNVEYGNAVIFRWENVTYDDIFADHLGQILSGSVDIDKEYTAEEAAITAQNFLAACQLLNTSISPEMIANVMEKNPVLGTALVTAMNGGAPAATPAETPAAPTAEEIAAAEAAAAAQAAAAASETPTAPAGSYTVEKGDCLFKIAQKAYGDGKLWRKIYEANKDQIKNSKEYIIYAGQNFVIPAIQ